MNSNGQTTIVERIAPRVFEEARVQAIAQARQDVIHEIVGRYTLAGDVSIYKSRSRIINVDRTRPDYAYWDLLRRGKVPFYELGALFAPRIEQIFASWTLGRGLSVALTDKDDNPDSPIAYTNAQLAHFINAHLVDLLEMDKDRQGLGDQYAIVNPDGSLSWPSPDTVEVETDPLDYRKVTKIQVTTKLETYVVIDAYEPGVRTITIKKKSGQVESQTVFRSLPDTIPVVHFSNKRGKDEIYGHPTVESLLKLFNQYDDVVHKMLDGVKLMGNPWPTVTGIKDTNAVINANDTAEDDTYTDKDGNTETRKELRIDGTPFMVIGEGGTFDFYGPETGFTEDARNALKALFLLVLDFTGIPEFIWGGQMTSSRSSAEVQLEQWTLDIQARQKAIEKDLIALCDLWLRMRSLVDPRIVVGDLQIDWPALIEESFDSRLSRITYLRSIGLITDKRVLQILAPEVDDPDKELEAARLEADARRERMFPDGDTAAFGQQLDQAQQEAQAA